MRDELLQSIGSLRSFILGSALAAMMSAAVAVPQAMAEAGFTGLQLQGLDKRIAKAMGLAKPEGVLVRDVAVGEAAAMAGLKRGDLIVEFDGVKIDTFNRLVRAASKTKPGQSVKVTVMRGGKAKTINVKLGSRPPTWKVAKGSVVAVPGAGLTLAALTPKIRKRFDVRWGGLGVLVTLIDPDFVKTTVLERGDLIVQVDQQEVWDPKQVADAYNKAKTQKRGRLLILVERQGAFQFMLLPIK